MGQLNLIKGNFTGKVGQLVGAKWKDKATVRSYSTPSNPNTASQQTVRAGFKALTEFFALFANQLQGLNSLNTKGQSIRNALVQLNKGMVSEGEITYEDVIVAKGGLVPLTSIAVAAGTGNAITITPSKNAGASYGANAKMVAVAVNATQKVAIVSAVAYSSATISVELAHSSGDDVEVYVYIFDGSSGTKKSSASVYAELA